ncbi:hypothetical protein GCM10023107_78310 [Actinoplanes octamycinicus]|nr:hypothetical protein Aoc01nite_62950 [Actinoplanes octamycinicus]
MLFGELRYSQMAYAAGAWHDPAAMRWAVPELILGTHGHLPGCAGLDATAGLGGRRRARREGRFGGLTRSGQSVGTVLRVDFAVVGVAGIGRMWLACRYSNGSVRVTTSA